MYENGDNFINTRKNQLLMHSLQTFLKPACIVNKNTRYFVLQVSLLAEFLWGIPHLPLSLSQSAMLTWMKDSAKPYQSQHLDL